MPPSISVVIPTYNRASLIAETLDSILGQSLPPAEVIVVDDGSQDDTAAVLARYGDRVRSVAIPNSGQSIALNTGIRLAGGALIAFCDSDDLWLPDHLARLARLWEHAPETNAAFANFRILREGIWDEADKFADAPPGFWQGMRRIDENSGCFDVPIVDRLIRFMPFFPSATIVRSRYMRDIGGWDEGAGRGVSMDFATILRFAEAPPLGVVFTPTVGIRKHARNFSGDVQAMNLGDAASLDYALRTRPSLAPHAEAIRQSIRRRRIAALETAFARRDFAAVTQIGAMLGATGLPLPLRLKTTVAGLPAPLRGGMAAALLAAGSVKSRLGRAAPG
jgi:glycosyltransferase involved in cell wall biosynthesis